MDAISLAIVVTVLSLGTVLVYLFKSDFEKRQKSLVAQSNSKKSVYNKQNAVLLPQKQPREFTTNFKQQQVPSEVSKQSSPNNPQSSNFGSAKSTTINNNNNKASTSQILNGTSSSNNIKASSVKQQQSAQQSTKQAVNKQQNRGKDGDRDNVAPTTTKPATEALITDSLEPSQDELDSSILLGVFNPANSKSNKFAAKRSSPTPQVAHTIESKKTPRKKQTDTELSSESISSVQLFKLLTSSNLSKNEVELAVEILLEKLESGESDWQQPKSDPLCRLKARLRDHEIALSTEIANHENTRTRLTVVSASLDQARVDLHKQQMLQKQLKEENSQLVSKLEQIRNDLSKQQMIQKQLKEENSQVMKQLEKARCETSNQQMLQKQIQDENSQTIEKVEQDKAQLQTMLLELQLINSRQEEMLERLRDERHMNEVSMKRTLIEMEQELKELQSKLSANSASHDERLRKEMSQVERELSIADQREQKLMSEMRELREGLSTLFPDIKVNSAARVGGTDGDWVHQYLAAVKQLAKTVDELRAINKNNNINNNNDILDSPSKKTVDKSTTTLLTNRPSSRVSSPVSNGRSSKAGSYYENDGKKDMETKLLELRDHVIKLEDELSESKQEQSVKLGEQQQESQSSYEQLIKELKLQKSKLEAQVKIGLDSLKMEQEKSRGLEEELSKILPTGQTAS